MGLFGTHRKPGEAHSLLIRIRLSDDAMGTSDELALVQDLGGTIAGSIDPAIGMVEGGSAGGGFATLTLKGPDADAIFDAIAPLLESHSFRAGSEVIKRYGPEGSPEERIDLHRDG